jgi:translation initiation factor IF-2
MAKNKKKSPDQTTARPPIVTLVGHIDHGKTSLLDKIRETRVQTKETEGITQHIGASQIKVDHEGEQKKITFIDTPGHAAFTKLRARGVDVTDLVVLVVAADEGVQEQTKESYNHIKAAEVPFIVAANKIDLPTADLEQLKGQLAEIEIIVEDYGGDIVMVPVSAETGEGIDELLEMILLMAEMEELQSKPKAELKGVVIESSHDRAKGALATVLVKQGTLKKGQEIYAEEKKAKVKCLNNWQGERVDKALPADAVEVLGFKEVPPVGAPVSAQPQEPETRHPERKEENELFKIVLKADVQGSIEAILANLPPRVEVVNATVGEVTDSDVFLAQTTGARLYAYRVDLCKSAKRVAEQSQVDMFKTDIIYELMDEVERVIEQEKDPLENKEIFGKAEILRKFKVEGKAIAGSKVIDGEVYKGQKVLLMRKNQVVGQSVAASMRHHEAEIKKAKKDREFGLVFSPPLDFKEGDVVVSYKDEKSD